MDIETIAVRGSDVLLFMDTEKSRKPLLTAINMSMFKMN